MRREGISDFVYMYIQIRGLVERSLLYVLLLYNIHVHYTLLLFT